MPTKPWVTVHQPDPMQEYLVLLTELPLKRWRDLGAFLLYTWRIQGQLRHTPGLLGYALRAHICTRQFWTLAAWEGEAALQQFVGEQPHGHVMMALRGKMAQSHLLGLLQAAFGAAPPRAGARSSMMPHHWQTG